MATTPDPLPLLCDMTIVKRETRLGKTKLYELMRQGRLRHVKAGRRVLVPAEALREFVASLTSDLPPAV